MPYESSSFPAWFVPRNSGGAGATAIYLPGWDSTKEQGIALRTSADPEASAVTLEVRDEGRGVAPDHLSHLCDPFFTTKREDGGTGLGLSISAGIVKEHGGTLAFNSAPGEGLSATLTLPVFKEHPA